MMVDPDAHLALACQKGDRAALELLFRRYVDRVWRYGWFVTRSREAAGEIAQDTFLRVTRSIGGFQGRSAFATWLFALTRSATAEWLRRERQQERAERSGRILRLVQPEVEEAEASTPSPDAEQSRQAVRDAIAELPAAQRDALILCEMVGMSIAEAAEVLGWGQSRVKVTVFRARRKVRDLLRPLMSDEHVPQADAERAKENR